jgi:hypothetical protein
VNPSCAPLRFGTLPVEFGAREAAFMCHRRVTSEPPPAPPCAATPLPHVRMQTTMAIRSGINDQDHIGAYPFDRSTMDLWTRSSARSTAAPTAQSTINGADRAQPWSTQSPAGYFAEKPPSFSESQKYPSTSKDPYSLVQVFMLKPLIFSVSFIQGLSLVLLHQNP